VLVLVEIGNWSDITDSPVWAGRHAVRSIALLAARIVNPIYSFATPGQRRERLDLIYSKHAGPLPGERSGRAAGDSGVAVPSGMAGTNSDTLSAMAVGRGGTGMAYHGHALTVFAAVKHPGPGTPSESWCTLHLFVLDMDRHTLKCLTVPDAMAAQLSGGKLTGINSLVTVYGLESVGNRIAQAAGVAHIDYHFYMSEKMVRMVFMALGFDDGLDRFDKLGRMTYPAQFDRIAQSTGELIRETMLKAVPLLDGLSGELLMKSGLQLANTDMPVDVGLGLVYLMNDEGFCEHPGKVTHEVLTFCEQSGTANGQK
jgi:hypothetical protein